MPDFRLGDIIDDYCVKCRRVTNHSIVSLVDGAAAKVRCRTCYNDHDYRHEQAPPSKKDLKKAELFKQVLANAGGAGGDGAQPPDAISAINLSNSAHAFALFPLISAKFAIGYPSAIKDDPSSFAESNTSSPRSPL